MWVKLVDDYSSLSPEGKKLINRYDKGMFMGWSLIAWSFSLAFLKEVNLYALGSAGLLLIMNIVYRKLVNRRR